MLGQTHKNVKNVVQFFAFITYKIKLRMQLCNYVLNCAFMSGENKLENTLNRQNIGLIGHCISIKVLQSSRKQIQTTPIITTDRTNYQRIVKA